MALSQLLLISSNTVREIIISKASNSKLAGSGTLPVSIISTHIRRKDRAFSETSSTAEFRIRGLLTGSISLGDFPQARHSSMSSSRVHFNKIIEKYLKITENFHFCTTSCCAGGELTDFVIVLKTKDAVKNFSGNAHISLGAGISGAAGVVGRAAEADLHTGAGGFAACYTYSRSKDLRHVGARNPCRDHPSRHPRTSVLGKHLPCLLWAELYHHGRLQRDNIQRRLAKGAGQTSWTRLTSTGETAQKENGQSE
ncbi:hypothetical protein KSP39_PZI011504 [Platanthera zijinensis]|uniref:Ysc84 actin-binding domain-containing protein n=1 Tax=Platanthera zijinensis TaxID=2320716 RepID=A0AAP0BII9_9ASPA